MSKYIKRWQLYAAMSEVFRMCEGFNVNPWTCVKLIGRDNIDKFSFTEPPEGYTFAIGIVEDKPMWGGETVYTDLGIAVRILSNSPGMNPNMLKCSVVGENTHIYISGYLLSLKKPEPKTKTITVTLNIEDVKILTKTYGSTLGALNRVLSTINKEMK